MMKEADLQPPDLDRKTGRPLKSTDPSTASSSRGASASAIAAAAGQSTAGESWSR